MSNATQINGAEISNDVVFQFFKNGLIASNYRARQHIWINKAVIDLFCGQSPVEKFGVADLTYFSNIKGLMDDPTCLVRDAGLAVEEFSSQDDLFKFLERRSILKTKGSRDDQFYREKTSILDKRHFGTFHQQLGAELWLKKRKSPSEWWYTQKFDAETNEVKANAYKLIQEAFIDEYFASLDLAGKIVFDFGCGNGMASHRFIEKGATVYGIDPDRSLLEIATAKLGAQFNPVQIDLSAPDPLGALPDIPVNFVWMSDVLMFYFYPLDGRQSDIKPHTVLRALTNNLTHGGLCTIMQPHGVFWLAPWLGASERPFTVLTEYSERLYSVTPSLTEVSDAVSQAGLVISRVFEPIPKTIDPRVQRLTHFTRNFPMWWVFECQAGQKR